MTSSDGFAVHAGTVDIGSTRALPLSGYRRRIVAIESDEAGLEANWVLFRNSGSDLKVLMVSVDALFSSDVFERELKTLLTEGGKTNGREDLEPIGVFVVASHTHYAPALDPTKPAVGPADPAHISEVAAKIANDILKTLEQATASPVSCWAHSREPVSGSVFRRIRRLTLSVHQKPWVSYSMQIAPNRRQKIDRDLRIWRAEDKDGDVRFVVASWPCHATSRSDMGKPSADFVSALRDGIRSRFPECPVLFLPGASSDIRPDFTRVREWRSRLYPYPFQARFAQPSHEACETFDRQVRGAAERCCDRMDERLEICALGFRQLSIAHERFLEDAAEGHITLRKAILGDLILYGLEAEVSSAWPGELGLSEDSACVVFSGCVGAVSAYLPTDQQVVEGGYEVQHFRRAFQLKGRYCTHLKLAPVFRGAISQLCRAGDQ